MIKNKYYLIIALMPFVLTGCLNSGIKNTVKFEKPDIKDDFCVIIINFQYCKCAFHNEYCKEIGMSKKEANKYVRSEYEKWLSTKMAGFKTECERDGGIFNKDECQYCQDDYIVQDGKCINKNSRGFVADGLLTNDCQLKTDDYDKEWKKYSDIDERLSFEERSYEAQQALTATDKMIDLMIDGFGLERDIELENQMQIELDNYKQALVKNIKTNLLKSFWRLSWVTYSTIKSGSSLGDSYSNLLISGASIETLGSGLKVIQGVIPANSSLTIDTSTLSGKAKSIGANVALEAIDSLGDPVKIATEFFKSSTEANFPSADLTDEEIEILKNQHIKKGAIDDALTKSQAANAKRESRIIEIETQIAQLQKEIVVWEEKEKSRVAVELEESCKKLKNEFKNK